MQFSVAVRNARLDAIEEAIGEDAILKIRTGAKPANCAAGDTGTVLATITLGANWMEDAASGQKAFADLPVEDLSADAAGTAAHFRIYAADGVTCHMQGTVSKDPDPGDLKLDNTVLEEGQQFSIEAFTVTDGNA